MTGLILTIHTTSVFRPVISVFAPLAGLEPATYGLEVSHHRPGRPPRSASSSQVGSESCIASQTVLVMWWC